MLYEVALPEVVSLLAALLSVPAGDRYQPLTLSPERQKQQTLAAVLTSVRAAAAQQRLAASFNPGDSGR
ncbi:MAG: hypothetical protein ACREOH_02820 [Candidatus Entotheonellia bacterium]